MKKINQNNFFIGLLALLFLLGGCGYTTKAFFLPSSIQSVFIETFSNSTDEHNLENELRKKLIEAFQNDGNLQITSSSDADTLLTGSIIRYDRQAMRYSNDESVQEYRLTITVNFEFKERVSEEIVVKADNFTGDASFYLTGSLAKSEKSARTDAVEDLSHRILNKIITLW